MNLEVQPIFLFKTVQQLHTWRAKLACVNCLRALARLQRAYFVCYLERHYYLKQSNYEKILNNKRSSLLHQLEDARPLIDKQSDTRWASIFAKIEHLSEIIFSLNQLRFRVSDYAIFEICRIEMTTLKKSLLTALKQVTQTNTQANNYIEFLAAIHSFEAISQRTLQVVAPEPIMFFFFIQDLYAVYDEIKAFYE